MITLAKFLLESKDEYNGHKSLSLNKLPLSQGIELCKELEQYTNDEYCFTCEIWSDMGYNISQKQFWKEGEHPSGHIDRLILSVDNGEEK